ncbi:ProQ/FINO family protein [Reinekea sp. G2M2-21]|uniref:ProQ/FINO family protein n=1 Tax=Reinekea sp. G2M2-21 TaxID=2788942 RepID=UPI0018AB1206|nr:ProQ/FinO family protein [Reinekea sp. G2M2-21]
MSEQQAAIESNENSQKKLEAKRKKEYEANRKALDELCEFYPEVFSAANPKPLQIGIHEAIAADGKLSKTRIRRALNLYVRMRRYIACLTEGADRVTLGGEVTGKVSAEEAVHAQEKLAEIDKKRALKKPQAKPKGPRKNPRKAPAQGKPKPKAAPKQATTESPEKAEQRMQAKLEALVNKKSN